MRLPPQIDPARPIRRNGTSSIPVRCGNVVKVASYCSERARIKAAHDRSRLVKALHGHIQNGRMQHASYVRLLEVLEACRELSKSIRWKLCSSEMIVKLRRF